MPSDTCLYLAGIGFDALLLTSGGPTPPAWADEDDAEAVHAAEETALLTDHQRVRELLLGQGVSPRSGDLLGAKWEQCGLITWPDRLPGLKTWAGQATLPKIITAHQRRLRADDAPDLFAVRGAYRTGKGEGPSGLDALTCQDPLDIGFSPSALGMDIECRPAVELLAIVGLESLPLVSFGSRECGFIHDGQVWRFVVEGRSGGYAFRWGPLHEWLAPVTV